MCLKKLWNLLFPVQPVPVPEPTPDPEPDPAPQYKKVALLFAINNYPGSANDLNGCLNDQRNVANKLQELFPGEFTIRKFADAEVTHDRYLNEVQQAISEMGPNPTVVVMSDSCFSGTNTKALNPHPIINRFFQNPDLEKRHRVGKRFGVKDVDKMNWILFSGCGESQTSADAFIDGSYAGAFSYFAFMKSLSRNITYATWHMLIRSFLPNSVYDQAPGLEGPPELLNRLVFEGNVLLIHYSGHGTQVYDVNGDEPDQYDEALYVYDKAIIDDEIHAVLQLIP